MSTQYIRYPSFSGNGVADTITIGQQVIGGNPFNILIIDGFGNLAQTNNILSLISGPPSQITYFDTNTGLLTSDSNALRDSNTFDTAITKPNGTVVSELIVGNPGIGGDGALLHRFNSITFEQGFVGMIDGAVLGNPFSAVGIIEADDGANLQTLCVFSPDKCHLIWSDASTGERSQLDFQAGLAVIGRQGLSGEELSFFMTDLGIGWQKTLGNIFFLPYLTTPTAGQCLGSIAGGAGQLDWITPAGGGGSITPGVTPVVPVIGAGNPTEVLYIKADGTVWSDSQFTRNDTTHETFIFRTVGGYDSSLRLDNTSSQTQLNFWNAGSQSGAKTWLNQTSSNAILYENNLTTVNLQGGHFADFSTSTKIVSSYIQDIGIANVAAQFYMDRTIIKTEYFYNGGSALGNRVIIDPGTIQFQSDRPSTNFIGLKFDFAAQTYAYGDLMNAINGWSAGLSVANRVFAAGDIGGVQNGTVLFLNDVSQLAAFGDPAQVTNGVSFICDNSSQAAASLGKVGGVTGTALLLDYGNDVFVMGDVNGNWGQSRIIVDDTVKSFTFETNVGAGTHRGLYIKADATPNNNKLSAGFGALVNESTGLRNIAIGPGSGTIIQDGTDSSYGGWGSGTGAGANGNNRNSFWGTLSGPVGTPGSDNSGIGYQAKAGNGVSGSLSLGSGAQTWQSNMVSFGGDSNSQKQTLYSFYRGIASVNAGDDNILFTKTSGSGTDISPSQWEFDTGNSTGNKSSGPFIFYVALRETGGSGSGTYVNLAQQNEIIRFSDTDVYLSKCIKGTPGTLVAANDLLFGNANINNVSGNTTINGLDANWINSLQFSFIFSGTLTLKHNTAPSAAFRAMLLAGSVDANVVPGCVFTFVYDSTVDKFRESARTYP